jgi:COMPASS component SWD3
MTIQRSAQETSSSSCLIRCETFGGDVKATVYEIFGDGSSPMLSACFSLDDKYVAVAKENAEIDIYNVENKAKKYVISNPKGSNEKKNPFTMVKWRPDNQLFKTHYVLGTVNSVGQIQHWHMATGKCISCIEENLDPEKNELNAFDYSNDGRKIAVCGVLPTVELAITFRSEYTM